MGKTAHESLVAEVRDQWKRMWKERIDDRVRAEGIAQTNYDLLFVEKGTVVLATRNFKLLTLQGILETHRISDAERLVQPNPHIGGWGRFVRTYITGTKRTGSMRSARKREDASIAAQKKSRRSRKGGRGWLHF